MRKFILFTLLILTSLAGFSQVKIGLNFSPALAFSRLKYESVPNGVSFNASGIGLRFFAGPEISFYMGENAAFVTGAYYALKRAAIHSVNSQGVHKDSVYNLQYIQLPAMVKLFTNEIATDMKVYFLVGGTLDIKISEKLKGYDYKLPSQFKPVDANLVIGSGIELQMGESTYFLIGARYTRGLVNSVKGPLNDQVSIKNDLLSLDLGIRF